MTAVTDQAAKEIRLHHGEGNDLVADAQLLVLKVDDFVVETKRFGGRRIGAWRNNGLRGRGIGGTDPILAPKQTVDSRDENGEIERFGKIVVSAPDSNPLENIFRAVTRAVSMSKGV